MLYQVKYVQAGRVRREIVEAVNDAALSAKMMARGIYLFRMKRSARLVTRRKGLSHD